MVSLLVAIGQRSGPQGLAGQVTGIIKKEPALDGTGRAFEGTAGFPPILAGWDGGIVGARTIRFIGPPRAAGKREGNFG